jgi:transposase
MVCPVAWSKKGTPSEVEVQPEGINLSILGCMSVYGLIALSQQGPKPNGRKKQKTTGAKSGLPHGTNSSHFLLFIDEIAILLNKLGLENMYIVMDNAAIHKTPDVLRSIHEYDHTPFFLPLYSPMLNPIKECWAKIKQGVRKTPLAKSEEAAKKNYKRKL